MALLQGGSKEALKVQMETVQPRWLAGVWPGAEIVNVFLEMFDSLRDDNHRNLADCIKAATGAADEPAGQLLHFCTGFSDKRECVACTCSASQWRPSGGIGMGQSGLIGSPPAGSSLACLAAAA